MPSLRTLHPSFRPYAERFVQLVRSSGAPLVVTSARRSWQAQAALYKRWKRGAAGVYTALPPGRSMHQLGLAFDMATPGVDPQSDEWLAWAGPLWRSFNGVWGGAADPVHFEASRGITGRA